MIQSNAAVQESLDCRRRELAGMTLGELFVAGRELRRRSKVMFEDLVLLEEALRDRLGAATEARASQASGGLRHECDSPPGAATRPF